jgi:hypothetical protein
MWKLVAHQLENARVMAALDKGRPRQASLRRAVSTAYYALFQALCETCAVELVGWNEPWESFTPIFRVVEHGRTAQVLSQRTFANTPDLQRLGFVFKELQAAREWADYSPEPRPKLEPVKNDSPFTRSEAFTLVELAEEAVGIIDRLSGGERLKLATRLVGKTRNS